MPKATIILPCYNVEKYLPRSIDTVLAQTFRDFELLVIIDGSPDNSKIIAEKYALQDHRVKVFDKENGGLSDARNYGLEKATGEYVYFLDSDDWIEPDLLEETVRILQSENLDLIIFGYVQDDEDKEGLVLKSTSVVPQNNTYFKNDGQISLDAHTLGILGYAWNKVYRREFLIKHNLRFEKGTSLVEDILFNIGVYINAKVLKFIDRPLYHYINRPTVTLMKTFHSNSFELKKRKTEQLENFLNDWKVINKKTILASSIVQGFRYCVHNLFTFQNQLSFMRKFDYINMMLTDRIIKDKVDDYEPVSISDKIYKYLIKKQYALIIASFAKITK